MITPSLRKVKRSIPLVGVAATAALVAGSLTPAARTAAVRLGVVDRPGTAPYKQQPEPIPALGGVAVAGSVGVGVLIGRLLAGGDQPTSGRACEVLGLAVVAGAVGSTDDVRPLPWPLRLAAVAGLGLAAATSGIRFTAVAGSLGTTVTVLWTAGVANAFNMIDNMDGLAAGTAVTCGAALAILADGLGRLDDAVVGAAIAGAATGFWFHNRHPATIYLGDGGALFIGTVLALLGLRLTAPPGRAAHWSSPVVVLGLPIFDAGLVVCSRLQRKRSPFRGGRDHTSHRLAATGVPVPVVSGALTTVSAALGAVGLLVARGSAPVRNRILSAVGSAALAAAVILTVRWGEADAGTGSYP